MDVDHVEKQEDKMMGLEEPKKIALVDMCEFFDIKLADEETIMSCGMRGEFC